mmetsp:Transcript_84048/g.246547  ORF Transcript_84048/g.246547 Transcript_84048/m.246547 type:complete len:366 (+) Transcript_84048:128-1225(+)
MRFLVSLAASLVGFCFSPLCRRYYYIANHALRRGSALQVRVLGETQFGDAAAYPEVRLTTQNQLEYMRDGFTVVRDALPPTILKELHQVLKSEHGEFNSVWSHLNSFDSDSLMDFYVYSSLGAIAAQLFQSPGMETEAEEATAFLWRDFTYFRHPSEILARWHTDREDCDMEALPPNATRSNRLRIWVPLEDHVQTPDFVNLSLLLGHIKDDETRHRFWRGQLEDWWANLGPTFSPHEFMRSLLPTQVLRLGDIVLHMPCIIHKSPEPANMTSPTTILFPTYAPGSGGIKITSEHATRACKSSASHAFLIEGDPSCFMQAWPPAARPERGSTRQLMHLGDIWEWLRCSFKSTGRGSVSPLLCHRI